MINGHSGSPGYSKRSRGKNHENRGWWGGGLHKTRGLTRRSGFVMGAQEADKVREGP